MQDARHGGGCYKMLSVNSTYFRTDIWRTSTLQGGGAGGSLDQHAPMDSPEIANLYIQ